MKKIVLSTFLVVVLTIISIVPAFAATYRIGATSWYYSTVNGFGSTDSYSSVSSSTLSQYLSNVRSAYPSYTYSIDSIYGGSGIGVYSSSGGKLGYLSTSGGSVYRMLNPESGSSGSGSSSTTNNYYFDDRALYSTDGDTGIEYSVAAWVRHVFNRLGTINTNISNILNNIYARLESTSSDGQSYSVAAWSRHIFNRLGTINENMATQFATTHSKLDEIVDAIRSLRPFDDTAVLRKMDDVVSAVEGISVSLQVPSDWNLTLPDDISVSSSFDDSRVRSAISGVEYSVSALDQTVSDGFTSCQSALASSNSHLQSIESTLSNVLSNQHDYTYMGFSTLFDSFMETLVAQGETINQSINNLDFSPGTSVSPINPFTRKIYNVLYNGVDGTGTDMVDVATSQLGVSEGSPYYTWYGFNSHVNWCACFVSWCADQCGYLDVCVPQFCLVEDGIAWYQSRGLWQSVGYEPVPGDIIFFDWEVDHSPDHVGIVADCTDGLVTTIEGNMGDTPGVVSSRTLSVDSPLIYGYGTPDYPAAGASIYSVLTDISRKLDHIGDFEPVVVGSDDPITGSVYSTYYVPSENPSDLNSLCPNGNFDTESFYVPVNCFYTVSDHVAEFTYTSRTYGARQTYLRIPFEFTVDHKYFISFDALYHFGSQSDLCWMVGGMGGVVPYNYTVDEWSHVAAILLCGQSTSFASFPNSGFVIGLGDSTMGAQLGQTTYLKNLWVIDLTEMYGAGNEPSAAEFEARYPDLSYDDVVLIPVTEEINIDNSTYLPLDVDSQEYVIGDFTAHSDTMSFTVTADTVPDLRVVACLPNGNQIVCNNIIENVNALDEDAGASVTYQVSLPASIPWVDSWNIRLDGAHLTSIGCFNFLNLGASARAELQLLSNISGGGVGAGYDDTVLISKLTDIENALSNFGDNVSVSIEQVSNVDIAIDNSAHDVFYVTDDDGEKSIVDLSGDSIKVVGKLMNFLYQAMFKDALNDAGSGIDGLYDFYLDDSEGVDVWAS